MNAWECAERLEEHARSLESTGEEKVRLAGLLQMAARALREKEAPHMLSIEEVYALADGCDRGREYPLFIEERGYNKPMPIFMIGMNSLGYMRAVESMGHVGMHDMTQYNVKFRLWDKRPEGTQMQKNIWKERSGK